MAQASDSRILRRWFAVAVVVIVVLAISVVLRPFAMPIAWAAILAFLMFPLQIRLTQRFKGRGTLAAGILVALTPIAIFTPLALLALAFIQQIGALGTALQHNPGLFDVSHWMDPEQHPRVAGAAAWLATNFDVQIGDVSTYLRDGVQQWASKLARSGGHVVLNAAGMVLRFFLMLFVLFFVLRDGPRAFARVSALLPLTPEKREALFTRLGKVLRAVVYGCGLTALAQGTLVTIGFAITGLSGPIVFGVLASVLALLPFGGAALVWVPGVLYLFAAGKIGLAIFLLVWGGVVSTADNFIRPIIISRYTPVPTLLVFMGVIGGVAAFGPIGFIIGPLILVLATELLRYAEGSVTRVE
jgi:predicted PurR-regulated permease PerM